jgi:hypothetical protein
MMATPYLAYPGCGVGFGLLGGSECLGCVGRSHFGSDSGLIVVAGLLLVGLLLAKECREPFHIIIGGHSHILWRKYPESVADRALAPDPTLNAVWLALLASSSYTLSAWT